MRAKSGDKGGRGGGRTDTAVDECRNEMIDPFLPAFCLVPLFVSFPLPAVLMPVSPSPSCCFARGAVFLSFTSTYDFLPSDLLASLLHAASFQKLFWFHRLIVFIFCSSLLCCCVLVPGTLVLHLLSPWISDVYKYDSFLVFLGLIHSSL